MVYDLLGVSLLASMLGAVCGIGGGILIKPVLDALGTLSVTTISFLSGCTVLTMSFYSLVRLKMDRRSEKGSQVEFPLALGAVAGGVGGKYIFERVVQGLGHQELVGAVQAACLLAVTAGTFLYTLKKEQIFTKNEKEFLRCVWIGMGLGILSSFLGIGGGPVNLVVLHYFFSMEAKKATQSSLYIIFFSQLASFLSTIFTGQLPEYPTEILIYMILGGFLGGVAGRYINRKITVAKLNRLFLAAMGLIMVLNVYNLIHFLR